MMIVVESTASAERSSTLAEGAKVVNGGIMKIMQLLITKHTIFLKLDTMWITERARRNSLSSYSYDICEVWMKTH